MAIPPLMPQQQLASDFIQSRPYAGVFLDMSGGKSLATLHALSQIRPPGHILVIAPPRIARLSWVDEIKKWEIPVRYESLVVNERDKKLTKSKRLEKYASILKPETPASIWFISMDLLPDLVEFLPTVDLPGHPASPAWPFPTVIIDESQSFKNPKSKRFRAIQSVRHMISRLILLSGTPAPNGIEDLWAQFYLLDQGASLGSEFSTFRKNFFRITKTIPPNIPVAWEPIDGALEWIFAIGANIVMSATNDNVEMVDAHIIDVPVHIDPDAYDIYRQMKKHFTLSLTDESGNLVVNAVNGGVLRAKLRQIASGSIYLDQPSAASPSDDTWDEEQWDPFDDDNDADLLDLSEFFNRDQCKSTKSGRTFGVLHESKLRAVQTIIDMTDSPVLLAYYFQSELTMLSDFFDDNNIPYVIFDGSQRMYSQWNEGVYPLMLIHPASSGHGLNLQRGGHTLIWYTLPDSLEHYLQTNKRLHRIGQTDPVIIYRLLSQGTIDTKVPKVLDKKEGIQKAFLDAVKHELLND